MLKYTLKVDGMACGMCEAHVNDAVRKVCPNVKKVTSSHAKGETVILTEQELDEEKLRKDQVSTSDAATAVHYAVGNEVREAIRKIDGTMSEDLPTPEKSIAQLEREQMERLKQKAIDGQLMLDE